MSVRIDCYATLGSGTYGTVSRVTVLPPSAHPISQTIWAGKWMPRFDTLSWHQTIISELCMPQSTALPRVMGAWINDAGIMIVMEGFESNAVHLMKKTDDPFPVIRDVCRGLADLHDAGIAHRDVKLDNVLMRKGRAFLCDFGLASSIYSPTSDESTCTFVTRAPEIWSRMPHSFAADMWSLGCVGYNLVTGKHVICLDAESKALRDVIDHLRDFSESTPAYAAKSLASFYAITKCLQFDASLRPSSRDLLSNLADGRRRRVLRKRPATVTPPPLKLVKSMTFPMQTYLSGQTFVGRPEPCLVLPTNRRAELLAIRDALYNTSFKTLLVTIDLFDRLPHKSTRTRICMAIYIAGLTMNCASSLLEITMAVWNTTERANEMEKLFLPALASLGWKFESTYTLLETMNLHEDRDVQRKILSAYLQWPDSRTREDMVREALSADAEEW